MKCQCKGNAEYAAHLKFNGFDIDGWVCKKCDLLVGGSVDMPPDVCPICEAKP